MFKRSTKLTALLVAAASVASTVPAMAATKLATKDGTIEKAVAYKDGKYLYQGYRTDEDDNGLYVGDGTEKDKMLDDAEEIVTKFGDKYVAAKDGSNDYVVDLSTGKITDEDTLTDLKSTAETKLSNKLNDADRYKEAVVSKKVDYDCFVQVNDNRFEDVYYRYTVAGTKFSNENAGFERFGYTTESGKYIDCSYDLNLYAYSTTDGGATGTKGIQNKSEKGKMYNVKDIEDTVDTDFSEIKVNSVSFVKYIGQDEKYIYSVIKVNLSGAWNLYSNTPESTSGEDHYYVQKVSKEQGEKEGDAYKPKSTECFEIAKKTGATGMGNGDVADAYDVLYNGKTNIKYAVVGGVIYASFEDESDKVKTFKIVLRTSEKLDRFLGADGGTDSEGNPTYQKNRDYNKISGHVARKDGDKDHSMTEQDSKNTPWTIDTNGTLWCIDEGKIYKSVKMGDFELVYTCDRSLDSIDVYDESNLIAWDSEGDVYTTVGEGSKAAEEEAKEIVGETATTEPAVTAKTGWDQLADGTWNLYDVTGKKVTGWSNVGGTWYYMDPTTAVMKTGWVKDNGTWYYCNNSGAMQTGWVKDNGTWYYCNASGAMQTGWLNDNGTWYYLNADGSMAANTTVDGYVLGANGAWIK